MSSVASHSSAVQFFRPLPAPRGPSAGADNAGEHTTPFAMLLDANSPPAHQPPVPHADRPARSEIAPQRRDDSPPASEQRADASPPSAPQNDAPNANGGSHEANSSKSDVAEASDDTAASNDNNGQVTTDDGSTEQPVADCPVATAQIASAQIVIGPAIVPVMLAGDATPAQPVASPSGATVATIATSLAAPTPDTAPSATAPTEQLLTAQFTPDVQSEGADSPAEPAKKHEPNREPNVALSDTPDRAPSRVPAALPKLANVAISAATTAPAETTATHEPAAATSPAEPTSDTAPATPATAATPATPAEPATAVTPATPAEPAKKIVRAGLIATAAPTEPAAPVDDATPAEPAAPATPAAPAKLEQKAAPTAGATPTAAADTQAPVISQSENVPTQIDSPGTISNPLALTTHDETAKNRGTKPPSEAENDNDHRLGTERALSANTSTNSANRIVEPALARNDVEITQLPTPSIPAAQVVNSAMPANAAPSPIAAATAAIPLAGLPIEIAAQASNGKNRFEIRLDPPELGRIDVRLDIDSNGNVTSRLVADRPETLDLLRRDAPQIERALQDAGLKTSNQSLQFSLRDQSLAQQNDDSLPVAANLVLPQDDIVPLEAMRQGYGRMIGLGGGIDIWV